MIEPSRPKARAWALPAAATVPYLLLCLPWADAVPMWDAREYVDCIENVVRRHDTLRCASHPTEAWTVAMSLLAWIFPDRFWAVLIMSAVLGVIGLIAFYDLIRALFPDGGDVEAAALTACFGVFPVFASGTVDVNPDHGVVVFFVVVLRCLVRQRVLSATLAGLLLVFTKEPGALLFGLAAVCWGIVFLRGNIRGWLRAWPLALPPLLFVAYLMMIAARGQDPLWAAQGHVSVWTIFTRFPLDQRFGAQVVGIFILQFTWVLTLLAVLRYAILAARALVHRQVAVPAPLLLCDVLLLSAAVALTRYRTFLNLRYYLALFPLLLIAGAAGLREIVRGSRARVAAIGAIALLFAISTQRTFDPVSIAAMGTVPFGSHRMLDMTRPTGECCGHGRDQMAYNLQHLHLQRLEDQFLQDIAARKVRRAIAAAHDADHHTMGSIDRGTFRRTLSERNSAILRLWTARELQRARPPSVLFVRFFFGDNGTEEARLRRWYRQSGERTYESGGYTLTVAEYDLRDALVR